MPITYAKADTVYGIGLQELGEAILKDSFRLAAKAFLKAMTPRYEAEDIHQAVIFIQGSGLEWTIEQYQLPFDPDQLRGTFQWKLQRARSSSATTEDGPSSNGA